MTWLRHAGGRGRHKATDLLKRYGGIMRIRRTIIIPAILALGAAGSILAATAAPAVVASPFGAHSQIVASSDEATIFYHA
jgi:hypothetical protein